MDIVKKLSKADVADLRILARENGFTATGTKRQLIHRLITPNQKGKGNKPSSTRSSGRKASVSRSGLSEQEQSARSNECQTCDFCQNVDIPSDLKALKLAEINRLLEEVNNRMSNSCPTCPSCLMKCKSNGCPSAIMIAERLERLSKSAMSLNEELFRRNMMSPKDFNDLKESFDELQKAYQKLFKRSATRSIMDEFVLM